MIRAELKSIHSPDENLLNLNPAIPTDFCVFVQLMIGPEESDISNSFDVYICTPAFLERTLRTKGMIVGFGYLVVSAYNYDGILRSIKAVCRDYTGETWEEVANQLSQVGRWEFSNYQI